MKSIQKICEMVIKRMFNNAGEIIFSEETIDLSETITRGHWNIGKYKIPKTESETAQAWAVYGMELGLEHINFFTSDAGKTLAKIIGEKHRLHCGTRIPSHFLKIEYQVLGNDYERLEKTIKKIKFSKVTVYRFTKLQREEIKSTFNYIIAQPIIVAA